MKIQFKNIEPHAMLKPYIEKMWVFESSGRLLADDLKLVVPNGNVKLTIAVRNGITAVMNENIFHSKEHSISLTGLVDVPLKLDVEKDISTETIGIEFNPKGVYRFFHFNLNEVKNQIYPLGDVLDNAGRELEEKIANAVSVRQKVFLLQQFLLQQLLQNNEDLIFEYCVGLIRSSGGKVTVQELEKKTGYSSRWLNMKFIERLGVSPKNLSSIIRFSRYYQAFISGNTHGLLKNDFYEYYYDQSHFIKNFKRFTGLSPSNIEHSINDFGGKFYLA